jgi:uncharacterized protein YcnI
LKPAIAFAVAVLALVAAPAALSHVVPTPNFVESGTTGNVSFASPNERDKPMTAFVVTVPSDLEILHAHGPDGWTATIDGPSARWTGGSLAPAADATFGLELRASGSPGNVSLEAQQRYADGVVRWPITLTITPAAQTPSQNFALAGAVGLIGVLVIAAVGALAWRRRAGSAAD